MAETKRYDVGGLPRGSGSNYPEGTILKLTKKQAEAMGLSDANVSDVTTTADDAAKARSYEDAMTRQDEMRAAELASVARTADGTSDDDEPEPATSGRRRRNG